MVSTLREAWPWLVRDDERWAPYLDAGRRQPASGSPEERDLQRDTP
jgi:hypothetical protein